MKGKMRWLMVGILLMALLVPSICFGLGGEVDPRDGFPGPDKLQAVLLYYRNVSATKYYVNGQVKYPNADLNANLAIARWVGYWEVVPKLTMALSVLQPYGYQNEGNIYNQTSTGLGDTTLVEANYFNWAKTANFTAYTDLSFYAYVPDGEYDKNKAINLGANRWDFRVNLALIAMRYKSFTFEQHVGIDWFTKNDEYQVNKNLGQDPIYSSQTHVTYDITKQLWLGVSYFYRNGGETQINGVDQKNSYNEQKWMGTAAVNITPNFQFMTQYAWDAKIDNGFLTREIRFRFAYAW